MTPHLPALLERIAGRRVLVVGDIMLDEYLDGDAARISPPCAGCARRRASTWRRCPTAALTTRKVRVVSRQQQFLRIDYETTAEIDAPGRARLLDAVGAHATAADVVVISDYAKGMLSSPVLEEICAKAVAAGRAVVIDPRPQHAAFDTGCDHLTPNWKEALALVGEADADPTPDAVRPRPGAAPPP